MERRANVLEWALVLILLGTNAFTLFWAFKKRLPATPESLALKKAIASFEREGIALLRIERIDPDDVFLRSPGRRA